MKTMPTPPSRICRSAAPGCQTQRQRTQDGRGPAHDGSKRVPDRSSTKGATGDSGLRDRHTPLFLLADGTETSSACGVCLPLSTVPKCIRRFQTTKPSHDPARTSCLETKRRRLWKDRVLRRGAFCAANILRLSSVGHRATWTSGSFRTRPSSASACSWLPIFILDLSIPDRVAESRPLIGCRNSEDRILRKARAGEDGEEVARLRSR